ncbi:hypothetical protein SDC9_50161 [bioreactor metagenome]|uniref:Uncharacterized protein n=1 Tax=bioreactor metagenome TaxID=1076179 RepID=A0A644WNS6_9ZZZZ
MKNKILFIVIIIMLITLNISVYAEPLTTGIETLDTINEESPFRIENPADSEALEKATEYLTKKSNEVIWFLQMIAQPACIAIFIICAYFTLAGTITGKLSLGIIGMILSVVIYFIIIYAQDIFRLSIGFIGS